MGASPSTSRTGTPPPHQGILITSTASSLPPIGGHSHTTRSNQSPPPLSNTAFPPLNVSPRGDIDSGDEQVYNPLTPRGGGSGGRSLPSASPPVIVDGGHDPSKWGALRDRVVERRERHNQLHPQKFSVSASESSRTRNPSTRSEGRSFNASHNNVTQSSSISNGIQVLEWSMTFGPTEECFNRMDAEGSILVAALPPALDGLTLVQQQERLAMGLKGLPKPGGRLRGSMFGKSPANKGPSLGVHDAFKPLNIPEVQLAYRRLVRGVTGRGQRDGSRVSIRNGGVNSADSQHQYHPSSFTRSSSTAGLENPLSTFPPNNTTSSNTAMDAQRHHRRSSNAEQQARRSRRRSSCDNPLVEIRPRSLSISSISSTSSPSSSLSTSVSSVDTLDSLPEEKEVPQSKIGASDLLQKLKGHHHDGSGSNSWMAGSAGEEGLDPQSTHMVGREFTSDDDALNNKDTADFFANIANDSVDCNSNVAPPNIGGNRQQYSGTSSRVSAVAFTHSNNTPNPTPAPTRFPVVSILDEGLPPRPPPPDNQPRPIINDNSSDHHHLRACSHHASFGSSCSMQTPMGGATPTTAHRGGMKHSVSRTSSFPSGALSNSSYLNKTNNAGNSTQSDPQQQHYRGSNSSDSAGGRCGCSSARTSSISTTATSSAQQQCNNSNGFESLMVVWPDSHTTDGHQHNTSAHIDDDPRLIHVGCSSVEGVSPPPPLFRPTPPASRRPDECSPPRFDINNNSNTPPPPLF